MANIVAALASGEVNRSRSDMTVMAWWQAGNVNNRRVGGNPWCVPTL